MAVSLVFGASGAIGRFLLPRLLASGQEAIAISREPLTSGHRGLRWVLGDLWDRVPLLPEAAAIFSLGPLDAFAKWFAETSDTGNARIVAIGSLSARTKQESADPDERNLSERLLHAEQTIAAAAVARGATSTVLRASLIYGAGLDRSLTPIARFARRWRVFPQVMGATGLRQPVHADDLAGACMAVAGAPDLPRNVYDLGGAERVAFGTMLRRVRESLGVSTLALPVPLALARAGAYVARQTRVFPAASPPALRRMNEDLIVEHAAAIADFRWSPRDFRPQAADWMPPPLP